MLPFGFHGSIGRLIEHAAHLTVALGLRRAASQSHLIIEEPLPLHLEFLAMPISNSPWSEGHSVNPTK